MSAFSDWRPVYDFWFPAGLDASAARHRDMFLWWFGGGANAGLKPFAPLVDAALARRLDAWRTGARRSDTPKAPITPRASSAS